MLVVGLTGGIAAGKSTASSEFRALGVPVIDADEIARQVLEPGEASYARVVEHFGPSILDSAGRIDRGRLGHVIFTDPEQRKHLNKCTHPYIRRRILWNLAQLYMCGHPMCVLDVPLLFESGLDRVCAKTVVIECPRQVQLERLAQRNGFTRAEAEARADAQMRSDVRAGKATRVVTNTASVDELRSEIRGIVSLWRPSWARAAAGVVAPVAAVVGMACVWMPWGRAVLGMATAWIVGSFVLW
ncbi:Dephospho-CoA kinase [Coemansia sp. RSA 1972]|nr:Dephospho-CoA kinase [Coemansia sp. RSA 1972]